MGAPSGAPRSARLRACALALAVAAAAALAGTAAADAKEGARPESELIDDIVELVSIPSVSALPAHKADVRQAVEWFAARLRRGGWFPDARVMETGGHPVVLATLDATIPDDAPTVTIYGHVDVQPVDPLDLWRANPYALRRETLNSTGEDILVGRGACDDKGNLLAALAGIEDYLGAQRGNSPVRVAFFVEGQEEIGSPQLESFIEAHKDTLATDYVLSADGSQPAPGVAGIVVGLRGAMALQVNVVGPAQDLHSGFWGGVVANPLAGLARLLSTLHEPDGTIAVDGFFDGVAEPTDKERESMDRFPFDEAAAMAELGIAEWGPGERGRSLLERRWTRPTIEVVGMHGGFTGEGIKTVLPSAASAKLSCRLVPGQTPARALAAVSAHLEREAARIPGLHVDVSELSFKADPYYADADSPANAAAARVLEGEYGAEPVLYRIGASIPAVGYFAKHLGARTTLLAFSHQDERAHSPNEFFRLDGGMRRARRTYAAILPALAEEHAKARAQGGGRDEL